MHDFGILISSDLKWYQHVCSISAKASTRSFQILHCFNSHNVWILLKAYFTYVRPILEYNTVVWSPYLKKDIYMIESVQKRFTKKICYRCKIPNTSYAHRLHLLNIKSLEYRRLEFDLVFLYKIINGIVNVKFTDFFTFCHTSYYLRRHKFHIASLRRPKSEQLNNFFPCRASRVWNKLPNNIVSAATLSVFKNRLKFFDLNSIAHLVYS